MKEKIQNTMEILTSQFAFEDVCLNLAREIAKRSKDPSTKVGAVIWSPFDKRIVSMGYNGFPRGFPDIRSLWENRDAEGEALCKYDLVIHAEMNALLSAPEQVEGYQLFCTHRPCPTCLKHILAKGIHSITYLKDNVVNSYTTRDASIFNKIVRTAGITVNVV